MTARRAASAAALAATVALALAGRLAAPGAAAPRRSAAPAQATAAPMTIEVLATHPHDRRAYTQGLVWDAGTLYESTGLYGASSLRRVELATGAVLQQRDLGGDQFGEGLARLGDRLVQLTWRSGKALLWDAATFAPMGEHAYAGEGWGLCTRGQTLIMSDGSDTLVVRDAATFEIVDRIPVQLNGEPLPSLNELECVGDTVYANVWPEPLIVRIDLATGDVVEHIDGTALDTAIRAEHQFFDRYECLNGIAHMPEVDRFLVTGKHWPALYEVRFRPAAPTPSAASPTPSATPPTPATTPSPPTATAPPTPVDATPTDAAPPTPGRAYLPWAQRRRP